MRTHIETHGEDGRRTGKLVRKLAAMTYRMPTWLGIVVGFVGSASIAGIDALVMPGVVFLMPLALVVAVVAWLSSASAVVFTVVFGSVVWSLENLLRQPQVPLATEAVAVVFRMATLGALGFFAFQLRRAVESEREMAVRDPLTGLLNRRGFFQLAEREAARSRRDGTPFTVVVMDLNDFKQINDAHGHSAGDQALIRFAEYAADRLRATDVLARTGGDEFAMVLPTGPDAARAIIETVIDAPSQTGMPDVKASAGAAVYQHAPVSLDAALAIADEEMYVAKRRGRGVSIEVVANGAPLDESG